MAAHAGERLELKPENVLLLPKARADPLVLGSTYLPRQDTAFVIDELTDHGVTWTGTSRRHTWGHQIR